MHDCRFAERGVGEKGFYGCEEYGTECASCCCGCLKGMEGNSVVVVLGSDEYGIVGALEGVKWRGSHTVARGERCGGIRNRAVERWWYEDG